MNRINQLNIVLGATALLLAIMLISQNSANKALQTESQRQALQIRSGQQTQQVTGQVAANIIRDLAQLSVANQDLHGLLEKHGFQVRINNQPNAQ